MAYQKGCQDSTPGACKEASPSPTAESTPSPEPQFEDHLLECAPCTADECAKEQCDPADPYVCTEGDAVTGCSREPWDTRAETCTACCDASACPPHPARRPSVWGEIWAGLFSIQFCL